MDKFLNGLSAFVGTLLFIIALPFILAFRLLAWLLVVLIVTSPLILIGFIVWVIVR